MSPHDVKALCSRTECQFEDVKTLLPTETAALKLDLVNRYRCSMGLLSYDICQFC